MVPREKILYLAGRLARQRGMEERAEAFFLRVLEIDPEYYDALMEEGLVRYRAGDYTRAHEMFRRASTIIEDRPWPYYYSGIALVALGDRTGAIGAFRKARERSAGEVEIFHALGHALESDGQNREAERQFAAAAHHHPQRIDAWSALLDFHLRNGNRPGAEDACSRLAGLRWDPALLRERCASPGDGLP